MPGAAAVDIGSVLFGEFFSNNASQCNNTGSGGYINSGRYLCPTPTSKERKTGNISRPKGILLPSYAGKGDTCRYFPI